MCRIEYHQTVSARWYPCAANIISSPNLNCDRTAGDVLLFHCCKCTFKCKIVNLRRTNKFNLFYFIPRFYGNNILHFSNIQKIWQQIDCEYFANRLQNSCHGINFDQRLMCVHVCDLGINFQYKSVKKLEFVKQRMPLS